MRVERLSLPITALARKTQARSAAEKIRLTMVPSRPSCSQTGKAACGSTNLRQEGEEEQRRLRVQRLDRYALQEGGAG